MPPKRGEHQRRRDADGGGEELDHARRTVAARTNSIVSPSITATSAEGTPICRCIESEPASSRPDEQRGRHDRQRLQRAEQRDRHRLEAEAEREALDQPVMDAENLDAAGEAGERARQKHRAQVSRGKENPA